jgi:tRNA pseudouridine55 synthase
VVDVDVTVECSSGTYIRALARDLGNSLGVGGHLTALRRTKVGPYSLDQARTLEQLAEDLEVLEMSQAARALMPNRELSADETTEISFGRRIPAGAAAGTPGAATAEKPAAAFAPDGSLVALLADSGSFAKPVLVFAPGTGSGGSNGSGPASSSGAAAGVQYGSPADGGGQA